MKFVNSSHCGLRRSVDSIRHAAAMVGLSKLKTWACFLAMGQLNQGPAELLAKANIRAKMCELLAREQGVDATDRFFTVGLLSVLDALIGQNMADVLEHLPLQDDLRDALLHRQGELGQTLRVAIAYKQGDWSAVSELGIPPHKVRAAYFEAVHWSRELLEALKVD